MLYHLFVDWKDLLSVDGQMYKLYINAFRAYNHSYTHPQDFYIDLEAESKDSDNESDGDP
jgi:hypothetical protein